MSGAPSNVFLKLKPTEFCIEELDEFGNNIVVSTVGNTLEKTIYTISLRKFLKSKKEKIMELETDLSTLIVNKDFLDCINLLLRGSVKETLPSSIYREYYIKALDGYFNEILQTADELSKDNHLAEASELLLSSFSGISLSKEQKIRLQDKLSDLDELLNFLDLRDSIFFKVSELHPGWYNNAVQSLISEVLKTEEKLIEEKLTISITWDIDWDKNASAVRINNTGLLSEKELTITVPIPPLYKNFKCRYKETTTLDFDLIVDKISIKSSSEGIYADVPLDIGKNVFENYISDKPYKYGKFTFEVKKKSINNNTFNDINLVKYSNSGPACVLYSMIMPGMGTLKVSHGKKGWGRFASFLISSGIAFGSKLYSDEQYTNFLSATDQTLIDKYYNNANISNKIFLISGGLSVSIYLHDIIWVFSKGIKNQKKSKYIKEQLRKGPIEIQTQPIKFK